MSTLAASRTPTYAAWHDTERADQLYDLLSPYAGRCLPISIAFICEPSVDRSLGVLAATLGRWEESAMHFDAAA